MWFTIYLSNFRGYKDSIEIRFDNLTVFVGKNDIGKSTILEALDIFFNDGKGIVKLDKDDVNKQAAATGNLETVIAASFTELPEEIIIDSTISTTLQDEFMLNQNGELEIIKNIIMVERPAFISKHTIRLTRIVKNYFRRKILN